MSDPARLPKGAPQTLRRFVKCEVDDASLDLNDVTWLGEIPLLNGATFTATPQPGTNRVRLTIDPASEFTPAFDLDISIVDGGLSVTVDGIAGAAFDGPIKEWTDALNRTLKDNGKQLRDLGVDGSNLRLRKEPIPVVEPEEPVTTPPPVTEVPEPEPEKKSSNRGCLAGIIAGVTAILVAIGVIATQGGDDDSETADSVVISTDAPDPTDAPGPTTTAAPTTLPPAPTTTVAQVGQADVDDGTDSAASTGAFLCALIDGLQPDTPTEPHGDIVVPSGPCEPGDVSTLYNTCDAVILPCANGETTPLVVVGDPGTDHDRQEPDAVTGEQGASTRDEIIALLMATLNDPYQVQVSATCDGREVNGAGTVEAGGTAIIPTPVYQYGTCTDRSASLLNQFGTVLYFPQADDHIVDASEPDPVLTNDPYAVELDLVPLSDIVDTFFADANTVNNVLGGRPAAEECFFFFEPQNVETLVKVLDGCEFNDHFWVFAAATTNVEYDVTITDTVVGTTSTYGNPLGAVGAPILDTQAFDTTGTLFDDSIFPCGYGFVAFTACTTEAPPMEAGGFVTVTAVMGDRVPLVADGTSRAHHVDFAAVGGGRYSITQDGDDWVVSASAPTRARALIRGNAITLVVPNDELPEGPLTSQWSSDIDGQIHTQPDVPIVGIITTPAVEAAAESTGDADEQPVTSDQPVADEPTPEDPETGEPAPDPAPTETIAEFYAQLSASVSAGDLGFALDRLDPRVFEVYPDSCPAALESFADPDLVIEFLEEGPVESWTYEANGQAIEIPDAVSVTIRLTGRGQAGEPSEAHLSIVDGSYRWFTFC